jgi:GDPmannose 4,6-dehydratase
MKEVFDLVGLNYENYLESSDAFKRPAEVPALLGDSAKARRILGWEPKVKFKELTKMMVAADIKHEFERAGVIKINPSETLDEDYYLNLGKEYAEKLKKK